MDKGYIHLYTGDGKGKTTAALGLTLRAAGAGKSSIVIQFMKGQSTSETVAADKLGSITIEQYGCDHFYKVGHSNFIEHRNLASAALLRSIDVISSGEYDVVVLDEIICTLNNDLITHDELVELIEQKPDPVELILTGRDAPVSIFDYCDLITEMKAVKHYFAKNVKARIGIEY